MSDRIHPITMPKWGLAMTEGLVAAWHAGPGDAVERGADLVDIETEKITNVVEAPAGGVLRRRLAEAGETLPVGALLAVIADPEVPEAEIDAFVASFEERFAEVLAARASEARAAGPEPQVLEAGGLRLRHLAMGEGEATPLVLLHGFGGDLNNWLFNQPALAEHRPVHALDLPGHGGSTKDVGEGDVASLAGAVEAFLDALELTRVHLAGHSLGGAVAATVAARSPARVASLTLIASAGLGPEIDGAYIEGFIGARRRKDLKPVVERLFADPGLVHREMLDDILKFKRLDGVEAVLGRIADRAFAGGTQSVSVREAIEALAVPVAVVWGAEDRIIPAAHAAGLAEGIDVLVVEGAGHMVHMEKAAEVNERIERTMERAG